MLAYLIVVLLSIMLMVVNALPPTETTPEEPVRANAADYVQTSPAWLANIKGPNNVVKGFPRDEDIKSAPLPEHLTSFKIDLASYPETNKQPPTNHPEVQAVLKQLDFSKVPKIKPRMVKNWTFDMSGYNASRDDDCWWSASVCTKSKLSYIPPDISMCPNKGDWGLNYDDGPYKKWWPTSDKDKEYDQPKFYNFLVEQNKQRATLFFVGSNIVNFPAAAQRALNDGHTICSHTWSHLQMTSLTNAEIVAQLYWTHKAIKQVVGVTPKCWRPPYGDVDDRVRAIAWQMGMRTILWDMDTKDWNLNTGVLKPEAVDQSFETWINNKINNNDTNHGHITLEHENSNLTVLVSQKWLPQLQKVYKVMPIHECINDPQPYWEESWVYPTLDNPNPPRFSVRNPTSVKDEKTSSATAVVMTSTTNNALFALFMCIIFSVI